MKITPEQRAFWRWRDGFNGAIEALLKVGRVNNVVADAEKIADDIIAAIDRRRPANDLDD